MRSLSTSRGEAVEGNAGNGETNDFIGKHINKLEAEDDDFQKVVAVSSFNFQWKPQEYGWSCHRQSTGRVWNQSDGAGLGRHRWCCDGQHCWSDAVAADCCVLDVVTSKNLIELARNSKIVLWKDACFQLTNIHDVFVNVGLPDAADIGFTNWQITLIMVSLRLEERLCNELYVTGRNFRGNGMTILFAVARARYDYPPGN